MNSLTWERGLTTIRRFRGDIVSHSSGLKAEWADCFLNQVARTRVRAIGVFVVCPMV